MSTSNGRLGAINVELALAEIRRLRAEIRGRTWYTRGVYTGPTFGCTWTRTEDGRSWGLSYRGLRARLWARDHAGGGDADVVEVEALDLTIRQLHAWADYQIELHRKDIDELFAERRGERRPPL